MTYVIVEAYKMAPVALASLLLDLVDRLERRYLNSDGHAQPRPPARHEGLAEPGRGPNPVVAQVK